jgi:hypothetical protein
VDGVGGPTFVSLSLLSELGEVDRIFTGLRHLKGEREVWLGNVYVMDTLGTRVEMLTVKVWGRRIEFD